MTPTAYFVALCVAIAGLVVGYLVGYHDSSAAWRKQLEKLSEYLK